MEQKSIDILLDNNTLQDIAANSDYDLIQNRIDQLASTGRIRIHLTYCSFIEQIKGIKDEDSFSNAQKWMRLAAKICNKDILVDPITYLKKRVYAIGDKQYIQAGNSLRRAFNDYLDALILGHLRILL